VLALPGTFNAPNLNLHVSGIPALEADQQFLLFYNRRDDANLVATEIVLGLFYELETARGRVYRRTVDDLRPEKSTEMNARFAAPRDADKFDAWLRATARGDKAASDDYLLNYDVPLSLPKYSLSQFGFSEQFGGPGPGRWFEFDSGQTMPWRASPASGQDNTPNVDEFLSLQQALAAWTNDSGSQILLSYAGTGSDSSNFAGNVTWNADLSTCSSSAPNTPYDCSTGGTLALGGSSASTPRTAFGSDSYYRRSRAFVCMRAGIGCFMVGNNGANGAEVLTHEVGHTLAFGHSCGDSSTPACSTSTTLNQAIMRASAHGDGRGASLGADDQAGAAVVYPAPGGGGGSNVGPTLSASSPASGSTTAMAGGSVGTIVSSNILFSVSGGSGSGTTTLSCSVSSGTVTIASGTPQTISVGGSASAVVARFTLTSSAQSGAIGCTATPQGGSASNFTYNFTAPAGTSSAPANNNFASATTISGSSATVTGSNVSANKESGEPSHASNSGGASVWWQWTASASGTTTLTTAGSSFDTLLAVYTGNSVNGLTVVASNDDDQSAGVTTSRLTFDASAGTTYRIAVDGFNGAIGSITLNLTGPSASGGGTCSTPCIYRDGFE